MIDFKKFVNEALADGMNLNDFAFKVTAAMNEIAEEQEKKKNEAIREKEAYLASCYCNFDDSFYGNDLTVEKIASLVTWFIGQKQETWSVDACKEYYDYIVYCMTEAVKMFSLTVDEQLKTIFNNLVTPDVKVKLDQKIENLESDKAKVQDFLNQLFSK